MSSIKRVYARFSLLKQGSETKSRVAVVRNVPMQRLMGFNRRRCALERECRRKWLEILRNA